MEIGIVADDLTGAADSLAPFARRGFRANVGFELKHSVERFPLAEGNVLAYDTATRDLPGRQADRIQATVRRAAHRLASLRPLIIFKKIDSTLRGHLRIELESMRAEFPDRLALVCPAFPAQGRTVQTGVLHIQNVPWTATEFAPAGMFASLTVRGAFGMESDAHAAELGIRDIRRGVEVLDAQLQALRAQNIHTVFCDATLLTDLQVLAAVILRAPYRYLPVGSGGLASVLADLLPNPSALHFPDPTSAASDCPDSNSVDPDFANSASAALNLRDANFLETNVLETLVQPFVNGRVLVVVGSLHAASRRQLAVLAERLQTVPVVIDTAGKAKGNFKQHVEQVVDQLCAQYARGEQIALLTTQATRATGFAEEFSWLPGSVAWRLCLRGQRANLPIGGLVICGGETAREFCRTCNGTGLRVLNEWQPGVAITHLHCEPDAVNHFSFDGLPLLTKAGGFGDDQTLMRCVGLL